MENRWKQIMGVTLVILGIALGGFGITQLLLPAKYAATSKIGLVGDVGDPVGLINGKQSIFVGRLLADPFFTQTAFEIMRSQLVLSNAIVTLNLNELFGRKYFNGKLLTMKDTVEVLKDRMRLESVPHTRLFSITYYSDNPEEAAQIANGIAIGCVSYYQQRRAKYVKEHEAYFQEEEQEIAIAETNLNLLRMKLGIQNVDSTNANQQPYWDAKLKLENTIALRVGAQFVGRAEPPLFPVAPNRTLGAVLCVVGFCLLLVGFFFLKAGREE